MNDNDLLWISTRNTPETHILVSFHIIDLDGQNYGPPGAKCLPTCLSIGRRYMPFCPAACLVHRYNLWVLRLNCGVGCALLGFQHVPELLLHALMLKMLSAVGPKRLNIPKKDFG